MGTQQMEPNTLRNRKPETMGSGEAPTEPSYDDSSPGCCRHRFQNCGFKLGRETRGLECTLPCASLCIWNPTVQNTPSYEVSISM